MLFRRAICLVNRRASVLTGCSNNTVSGSVGIMLSALEKPVTLPAGKQFLSTVECEKLNGKLHRSNKHDIDEEYEQAIKALNTLQSNAFTIRHSITFNNKQIPLDDTYKYLHRSGLSSEEVDKLSFIHVSGTKGKGSTCALTESILREHGAKTGFFSSPHLVNVTERIRINGEPLSKAKFTRAFWHVFKLLEAAQEHKHDMPAYFKFLTILCFHVFIAEKVDVVILEVGIGGELDCTNIISNTKTVGITSLGLEHTQLLGDKLEEIAWQKAGIIKPHCNVYTSVTQPECLQVIKERTAEKNATLHIVPDYSIYLQKSESLAGLNNVTQLNGSLAIQLAHDWIREKSNTPLHDYDLNSSQLPLQTIEGLRKCSWPGRCQKVKLSNLNVHLDGAHTVESMVIASDWFEQCVRERSNPRVLIFNTTGDRNSRNLMDVVRQKTQFDIACFVPNISFGVGNHNDNTSLFGISEQIKRAKLHASIWYSLCEEADEPDNSHFFGSILDSFGQIQKRFGTQQEVDVLVVGSLHLIGATIVALNEFKKRLKNA